MTSHVYREIACRKAVDGNNFSSGVQDYDFSIGNPTSWIPSKCFFRIDMTITGPAGAAQPTVQEQVAFADSAPACLWDNVYFRAGGQDVSSIVNYAAQASQTKTRLSKSGAWLDSVGRSAYLTEADLQKRINQVASDASGVLCDSQETVNIGTAGHYADAQISILAADGRVTGINTLLKQFVVGDSLVVNGVSYTVSVVATTDAGTAMVVSPWPDANITTSTDVYAIRCKDEGNARNQIFAMYKPPIGIFEHEGALGAGDFRFQLNPNANYKTAAVQTSLGTTTAGTAATTNYNIVINDVKLYVATVQMIIPNQVETLHLNEMLVQSKVSSNNATHHFTVPPSTSAISIFVQSNDAGSNARVPPTLFATKDGSQNNLTSLQCTYGNITKPSTRWASAYSAGVNQLQHRYVESLEEAGLIDSEGGAETMADWISRGPLIHYSYLRDASDMSTELQLQVAYSALEAGANLFVVAHYRKTTRITTSNGMVVSVESLAR